MLENLSMLFLTQVEEENSIGFLEKLFRWGAAGDESQFYTAIDGVTPVILAILILIPVISACFYYFVMKPTFKKLGLWFLMMFINAVLCFAVNFLVAYFGGKNPPDGFALDTMAFLFQQPLFYSLLVYFITSIIVKRKSSSNYNVPW